MWFRVEWRARWRALVGLLLLIAFATASVEAAVAGARRGATAVDRLLEVTEPATLMVLLNRGAFDWDVVRAMPQVESLSAFAIMGFGVEGIGDHPEIDPTSLSFFPFVDREVLDTIERPVVLDGRRPDPSRADEVAVTANFAGRFDKDVGDRVTLRLFSAEQLSDPFSSTPQGPTVDATIVGVLRSPLLQDTADNPNGFVFASPGLHERYPDNVVGRDDAVNVNAIVRLEAGGSGVDEFEREFTRVTGFENVDFQNLDDAAQHTRDVTAFEARALLLLALTALLASMVLIGVAISRFCAASFVDLEVLRTFGLTPAQTRACVALAPTTAAAGGVVLAGVAALWMSRWFPFGNAAFVEPSPGTAFDPLVLLPALIVVPLYTIAASLVSLRSSGRVGEPAGRVSFVEATTATWPLTLGLGTRFALSGRSNPSSASGRPALVAAVLGVAGVTAALTFAHGIADATDGYERFGQTYELGAYLGIGGQDFVDAASTLATIAADPDVDGVLDAANDVANTDNGSVSVFTYAPVGEPLDVVVTDGRLPVTSSEIALAPLSAEQEGVGVGDTVTLTGPRGASTFTVTGVAFVPAGPHNGYASGGWVRPDGFQELFDGFRFHFGLVSTAPGTDMQAVVDRLADNGISVEPGPIIAPLERSELAELETIPLFLAGFLALLGIGAVAHTLASTARRRRHDIAMLRALGMRPRNSGAIVFVQAGAIALVGLVIGLPLGIVLGRSVWRSVALDTPVEFVVPDNWGMIASIALAVVALAALLAVWPSRRCASLDLAEELRSE